MLSHGDITVRVSHLVLAEVAATSLLTHPATACFASGANRESWSDEELCDRVAAALAKGRATWYQRHMAIVAAAMVGRYDPMVAAMERAGLEPVIIEDLVRFGEDRGIEKGLARGKAEGRAEGKAEGVLAVLEARGSL